MNNNNSFSACIVDDDPIWTNMLSQSLHNVGLQNITSFSCGIDFLQQKNHCPKVIFLDFQMEKMNGIEVLQHIKSTNPETEVVFCTSIEDLSVAISALNYGSKDFLLKSNVNQNLVTSVLNQVFPNLIQNVKAN